MSNSGIWDISFAGTGLVIDWTGRSALTLLRALFEGHSTALLSDHNAIARFSLQIEESKPHVRLQNRQQALYTGADAGQAAGILLDRTVYELAYPCRRGALFHAAALFRKGKAILLPGKSGTGKTTLALWLTGQGWEYLSDETVCIEQGTLKLEAFCRAFHLKTSVVALVSHLFQHASDSPCHEDNNGLYRSRRGRGLIVPVKAIAPHNCYHIPELRSIIFPRFMPDSAVQLRRLSNAETCMRLMGCLINARNLPQHGLPEISRLARQIPAYSLIYSQLAHVTETFETLL